MYLKIFQSEAVIASSQREKLAPKSNLKELTTLENVKSFNEEVKITANSSVEAFGAFFTAGFFVVFSVAIDKETFYTKWLKKQAFGLWKV
jgi:hypothetical protein